MRTSPARRGTTWPDSVKGQRGESVVRAGVGCAGGLAVPVLDEIEDAFIAECPS